MNRVKIKISSKGQIAIPKKMREKLSTDLVEIEMTGNEIIIRPAPSILEIGGSLKQYSQKKTNRSREKEEKRAWEKHVKEKFGRS